MRRIALLAAVVVFSASLAACAEDTTTTTTVGQPATQRTTLPDVPSATVARMELTTLVVAPRSHESTYKRSAFRTWDTVTGHCDARETVLKRDGTGVVVDASCRATAGTWYSPYDGQTWSAASDVDIDHVVPLKNAWVSGAWAWTAVKREQLANDLSDPQLLAVTDNVNQGKGDSSPDEWKPPLRSFWCTYAEAWVQVKHVWALTITSAEKDALAGMLKDCT